MADNKQNSWIVGFWAIIFSKLEWISLFRYLRKKSPGLGDYYFVDCWVLGHLLLAIVGALAYPALNVKYWKIILVILIPYGSVRVFEIIVYQTKVALFGEYWANKKGKTYTIYNYQRTVILLLHNYVEIIFWFTLFYRCCSSAFKGIRSGMESFLTALNYSFSTMSTFSSTQVAPIETLGDILVLIQSAIGLFMVLVILSQFIGALPKPATRDPAESTEENQ